MDGVGGGIGPVLPLRAAQPELLYAVNFDDPAVRAAVDKCPFAKVEKDFEGTSVLTVTVRPDQDVGRESGCGGHSDRYREDRRGPRESLRRWAI